MTSSFFYLQAEKTERNCRLVDAIEAYANEMRCQIYLIDRPLGDSKYQYENSGAMVLLSPNHKISFMNFSEDPVLFDEFVEDFIEDLGSIADKYRYKEVVGRPRVWKKDLTDRLNIDPEFQSANEYMESIYLESPVQRKSVELLISLLTGSINDIEKVRAEVPENILDKIKQKIVLFDGDQTRFVYQQPKKKAITVQGLSGTGKTELLLHKLRDIYVENDDAKIIFTCHNKILAATLRSRIPEFFNFMRVEEQIKWNKRLWCVNAWGSQFDRDSGAYSYICDFYGIGFSRYSPGKSFDDLCKKAIADIQKIENRDFAFDFMLIDESQDFKKSFFDLCEIVTRKAVYIAGDIFQSIFDDNIAREIEPDFLLSKCYRTDPKTLMFAHALGMGLFESPKLRWLEDEEWKACGYLLNKDDHRSEYELSREPLRRFEDLEEEGYSSIEICKTSKALDEVAEQKVVEIISNIRKEHPTVEPDDIGVIFIDNSKNTYRAADSLEYLVPENFGWAVNKAYESKERVRGSLFVSNRNNVKGLEFPFVICVTKRIGSSRSYRNALYMMLTRSFIRSYLLISEDSNLQLIDSLESGLLTIRDEGVIRVLPPTASEMQDIVTSFKLAEEGKSLFDCVEIACDELDVSKADRRRVHDSARSAFGKDFEYDGVLEFVGLVSKLNSVNNQ